jgi:RHS repeat-associated protein
MAGQWDYAYDVYDQRIGKVTPTGTERFVYGQNQNIALAFDGSGALTNRYLHGNSIDEVLADEANGSVGWALTDNLGSVRDVVDTTGTSQNHVVFDSFGNVTSESNPDFKTRFSFTGREFDAETGNYDYRLRPYRPNSGRFIEEDAVGFNAGDMNRYRYVLNSPSNYIDPMGFQAAVPFPQGAGIGALLQGSGSLGESITTGAAALGTVVGGAVFFGLPELDGGIATDDVELAPRRRWEAEHRAGSTLRNRKTTVLNPTQAVNPVNKLEEEEEIEKEDEPSFPPDDPNLCKCETKHIPRKGGHKRHDAYATHITGSVFDYYIRTPQGLGISYDGLTDGTRDVWEVKATKDTKGTWLNNAITHPNSYWGKELLRH